MTPTPHAFYKALFTSLLLLSIFQTEAQDFRPGYIIKANGDSTAGFVRYSTAKRGSKICVFKATENGTKTSYQPDQLSGYGIYNDRHFISIVPPAKENKQKVFARILASGPLDLYRYNKQFIVNKESMVVLAPPEKVKVETKNGKALLTKKPYAATLNMYVGECGIKADSIAFDEGDITRIVDRYNRCKERGSSVIKRRPIGQFAISAFVMPTQSQMTINLYDEIKMNNTNTVAYGIGMDISSPRIFDKLFLSSELVYSKLTYQGYHEGSLNGQAFKQDIILDITSIRLPIGIRYNFLVNTRTPYFKIGIAPTISVKSKLRNIVEREVFNNEIYVENGDSGYYIKNPKGIWISVGYQREVFKKGKIFGELRYERGQGYMGDVLKNYSPTSNYSVLLGLRFN